MINKDRIIESFMQMTKISSPSLKERKMADYLIDKVKKIGLEVYEDSAGEKYNGEAGNVIAILKGKLEGQVMFSSHMDTVKPCEGVEPVIKKDRIVSNGETILGGDDKAGVAAILEAVEYIIENEIEHPDLVLVFSIAEEIGLLGASEFDAKDYKIKYGFILDSSGKPGTVVKKAPYHDKIDFTFKGIAAHAGIEPEKGINALWIASKVISKFPMGRIDEDTTFNLGMVKGGIATNIVMEEVKVKAEIRSFDEDKIESLLEKLLKISEAELKEYNGVRFSYKKKREYEGFDFPEDSDIMKLVKKASENLGLEFEAQDLGGGSDTNIYNSKGINTVNLGIGMSKVHSNDEYILIEDLINSAKILIEIIKEY